MVQGELFKEERFIATGSSGPKSFLSEHRLILTLDKLVVVFLSMAILTVLTYSYGVESGKRFMENKLEAILPAHSKILIQQEMNGKKPPEKEVVLMVNQNQAATAENASSGMNSDESFGKVQTGKKQMIPLQDASEEPKAKGKYTVQLVTYTSEKRASEEINALKQKGFSGFIIPSGSYFQVCADYFQNTDEAKSFLRRLRQEGRYPDAYVRPVAR